MNVRTSKSNAGFTRLLLVVCGAASMSLGVFLVLPVLQAIGKPPKPDLQLTNADVVNQPPPPVVEDEPEQEEEVDEQPPELAEDSQPLDLAALELALNPGLGGGLVSGDFAVKLNTQIAGGGQADELFSMAELDQKPRIVYQPLPVHNAKTRQKAPGTVYVIFVVDKEGRVQDPRVQSSSDPVFDRPAVAAVKQWRFESSKRKVKAVRFRMRIPITFPG